MVLCICAYDIHDRRSTNGLEDIIVLERKIIGAGSTFYRDMCGSGKLCGTLR